MQDVEAFVRLSNRVLGEWFDQMMEEAGRYEPDPDSSIDNEIDYVTNFSEGILPHDCERMIYSMAIRDAVTIFELFAAAQVETLLTRGLGVRFSFRGSPPKWNDLLRMFRDLVGDRSVPEGDSVREARDLRHILVHHLGKLHRQDQKKKYARRSLLIDEPLVGQVDDDHFLSDEAALDQEVASKHISALHEAAEAMEKTVQSVIEDELKPRARDVVFKALSR
jgi:hypothetical protein